MNPTPPPAPRVEELIARLGSGSARLGVVGLGYVGLPVALAFAEAGFEVIGVDVDKARVDAIQASESYLREIPSERIAARSRRDG